MMPRIKRREFVPHGHHYDPRKHHIGGWFMSEKLDGQRCFWDGGVSRGLRLYEVPYGNNSMELKLSQVCTGLWSRYGNIIHAPDYWLDMLPNYMLDGELYIGRKTVEQLRSTISRLPENRIDEDWKKVKYHIYGLPSIQAFCELGEIKNKFQHLIMSADQLNWILDRKICKPVISKIFEHQLLYLERFLPKDDKLVLVKQTKLPNNSLDAANIVNAELEQVVSSDGEGMMVADPKKFWVCTRSYDTLKIKSKVDATARIIGFKTGKDKYCGMLGSLHLQYDGITFYLSGMSDHYRALKDKDSKEWAMQFPGKDAPTTLQTQFFKIGDLVAFEFNGLTVNGDPKEARFVRKVTLE